MHRPISLIRTLTPAATFALAATLLASTAGAADDVSLSDRLAQLRQSWAGETQADAKPGPEPRATTPRTVAGDLFDALGGNKAKSSGNQVAKPMPRVASRQMPTSRKLEAPSRQRAGSVLGTPAKTGGFDIGAALGGAPKQADAKRVSDAPAATTAKQSPAGSSAAATASASDKKPAKVALNPTEPRQLSKPKAVRRRASDDLAMNLISSTASSRDTRGVGSAPAVITDKPADLFPMGATVVSDDVSPLTDGTATGFATAADAAAAAEVSITDLPGAGTPPVAIDATETITEPAATTTSKATAETTTEPLELAQAEPLQENTQQEAEETAAQTDASVAWNESDSASETTNMAPDATSSATAERAFGSQQQVGSNRSANLPGSSAAGSDAWISTSTTLENDFHRQSPETNVLMTEALPLITSKVTGPKTILIGREAKYQVTIVNRGTAAADQLATEVVAPEWADVVHVIASSGAVQRPATQDGSTTLRWEIASLAAGRHQTLDLVVVPKTSQPLSLGVNWRHAPVGSTTLVEVQEPKLNMAISGPDEVFFGRAQTYRLSLSNPGTGAADNVVVQLMPPGGGQAVSSYRVEKLAAGETKTVDIEITAREPGELSIKAVAAADGNLRTEAAQQIFCRQAELNVDWRGPARKYAGTEATYYFRVRNPGTASAEQVEFDVSLPAGFEFRGASDGHQVDLTGQRVVWKIGTLRPGDDCYLELRGILNQAGNNAMRLSAANTDGDVNDNKTATTEVIALADLKLDVSDPKGPVPVGAEVDYEITVTNRGRSTAEDVNIVGMFSSGIEPMQAAGAEATIADGRVGFRTIGAVPAGQQVKLKIRARAQTAGTHLFRAEVVCRDLEIKLAAEETTRFFQDESTAAASGVMLESASRASRFE